MSGIGAGSYSSSDEGRRYRAVGAGRGSSYGMSGRGSSYGMSGRRSSYKRSGKGYGGFSHSSSEEGMHKYSYYPAMGDIGYLGRFHESNFDFGKEQRGSGK